MEKDVMNCMITTYDFKEPISIRMFFIKLLAILWIAGEDFSGKRPFGNSGWKYPVYAALIKNGFIEGELDENGDVKKVSNRIADTFILENIIYKL